MFSIFLETIFPAVGKVCGLITTLASMTYNTFWGLFNDGITLQPFLRYTNLYTGTSELIQVNNWGGGIAQGLMNAISTTMRFFGNVLGISDVPAWLGMIIVGIIIGILSSIMIRIINIFS